MAVLRSKEAALLTGAGLAPSALCARDRQELGWRVEASLLSASRHLPGHRHASGYEQCRPSGDYACAPDKKPTPERVMFCSSTSRQPRLFLPTSGQRAIASRSGGHGKRWCLPTRTCFDPDLFRDVAAALWRAWMPENAIGGVWRHPDWQRPPWTSFARREKAMLQAVSDIRRAVEPGITVDARFSGAGRWRQGCKAAGRSGGDRTAARQCARHSPQGACGRTVSASMSSRRSPCTFSWGRGRGVCLYGRLPCAGLGT